MRPEARLDSVVFQLTPTRTRCDLVIFANGKTEKIASGLLNPFLAHLKSAQGEIAKGGYSITLEADPNKDREWFTKGTVERFVRFVSTPEILERVNIAESEILQIEDAIAFQTEDQNTKASECIEGNKASVGADAGKAIVLFKPGALEADSNGLTMQEENSKVHLLKVLENRKTVLQKEQSMAFARAVAAGFDMDQLPYLVSFAEAFGASRLKEASLRFMGLWKTKHETGQWLEIDAAERMSSRSEFSLVNTSGIVLSGDLLKQNEFREAAVVCDFAAVNDRRDGVELSSQQMNSEHNKDKSSPLDQHAASLPQAQFLHPMFPQWPMQPPPGPAVFQPYLMQGVPYHQNYPGAAQFFPSPYLPMDDPRHTKPKKGGKRRSVVAEDSSTDSETSEDVAENISGDDKERNRGRSSRKKSNRSHRRHSDKDFDRNTNRIAPKKHSKSESESQSASDSESGEENGLSHSDALDRKHRSTSGSLKKKLNQTRSIEVSLTNGKDEMVDYNEANPGNWDAFQSFLMKNEEETARTADQGMFAGEGEHPMKRREGRPGFDPIQSIARDTTGNIDELKVVEFDSINSKARRIAPSNDVLQISEGNGGLTERHLDPQLEIDDGNGGYRRASADEFIFYGQQKLHESKSTLDPFDEQCCQHTVQVEKKHSTSNDLDESFMVPLRAGSPEELRFDRTAFTMDTEIPIVSRRNEDSSNKIKNQLIYETHDFYLLPEREMERESVGYDPANDYDMQIEFRGPVKPNDRNQESEAAEELDQLDKEANPRDRPDGNEKRKVDLVRKGKSLKSNPLADARTRAEKLRAYKVDLRKSKKEKEEEAIKRLEALKLERQKRISERSASKGSKISSSLPKGSKLGDTDLGALPTRKLPFGATSVGSGQSLTSLTVLKKGSRTNSSVKDKELKKISG